MSLPRVCYLLGNWVSHRRAGELNRSCLAAHGVELVDHPAGADVVVIHNEPWTLASYFRALPELRDRRVVAYCVWETDRLPARWAHNLQFVDEIWTCSTYCAAAFGAVGPPVHVVPHVVQLDDPDPAAETWLLEVVGPADGRLTFYTIGTVANPRKAVDVALRAFDGLFAPERARMIVKTERPLPAELARIPGVVGLDGWFDDARIRALHTAGDVFVSAHRSEGWGLGLSEAMLAGNVVIATAHGGNTEFMDRENSLLVSCCVQRIGPADVERQPSVLTPEMQWGYIDEHELRATLGRCADEWDELAPLRANARRAMERFTPERVAEVMLARLA